MGRGGAAGGKPLEIGTNLLCRWRDGQDWMCEIVERKQNQDTMEWQYYVHYLQFNRRLDEWVSLDRLNLGPSQDRVGPDGKKMTRTSKRKIDEAHHDEEEGELDAATLKEHEEACATALETGEALPRANMALHGIAASIDASRARIASSSLGVGTMTRITLPHFPHSSSMSYRNSLRSRALNKTLTSTMFRRRRCAVGGFWGAIASLSFRASTAADNVC